MPIEGWGRSRGAPSTTRPANQDWSGPEQSIECVGRLRTTKKEALNSIASKFREGSYLSGGFRTFRNRAESKAMSQSDDGADDGFVLLVNPKPCDE